jgi:hypothetical protein
MKIPLSRLTLFSPDELMSYWWISEDFAGLLGLEFSRDAAKLLKTVIPRGLAKIDYEADAVTVRMSRNDRVIPTLEAIYRHLDWDATELTQASEAIVTFKRPLPRKVQVGDIFIIPITPELFGVGQVLALNYKAPTVVVFKILGSRTELEPFSVEGSKPLTILHIHGNSLYTGDWEIVTNHPVALDPSSGPGGRIFTIGSSIYGGDGPIVDLLSAHAGLRSWEEGYGDPRYLRSLLI